MKSILESLLADGVDQTQTYGSSWLGGSRKLVCLHLLGRVITDFCHSAPETSMVLFRAIFCRH